MKSERVLGVLILSELVLAVLGGVTDYALEPFLPTSLHAFLAGDGSAASGHAGTFLTALWFAVVAGTVLSWVGLLFQIRAARPLYVGTWVAYLVLLALGGPVVSTSVTYVIQMLMALAGGAIVGVIYFSDLRTGFRPLSRATGRIVARTA